MEDIAEMNRFKLLGVPKGMLGLSAANAAAAAAAAANDSKEDENKKFS